MSSQLVAQTMASTEQQQQKFEWFWLCWSVRENMNNSKGEDWNEDQGHRADLTNCTGIHAWFSYATFSQKYEICETNGVRKFLPWQYYQSGGMQKMQSSSTWAELPHQLLSGKLQNDCSSAK